MSLIRKNAKALWFLFEFYEAMWIANIGVTTDVVII